jgi:hypothetical protein
MRAYITCDTQDRDVHIGERGVDDDVGGADRRAERSSIVRVCCCALYDGCRPVAREVRGHATRTSAVATDEGKALQLVRASKITSEGRTFDATADDRDLHLWVSQPLGGSRLAGTQSEPLEATIIGGKSAIITKPGGVWATAVATLHVIATVLAWLSKPCGAAISMCWALAVNEVAISGYHFVIVCRMK